MSSRICDVVYDGFRAACDNVLAQRTMGTHWKGFRGIDLQNKKLRSFTVDYQATLVRILGASKSQTNSIVARAGLYIYYI